MAEGCKIDIGCKYNIRKAAIEYLTRDFIDFYDSKKSINPRTCPECMSPIEKGVSIDNQVYCTKCIEKVVTEVLNQTS